MISCNLTQNPIRILFLYEGREMSQRKPALNITVERITPAAARAYLEPNRDNRKVRQERVERYAREMVKGHWMMAGDPIRFSDTGRLIDGQHRLLAIVAANKPMEMVVMRGTADETFRVLDSGLQRSNGDSLGIGVTNALNKAATVRVLWVLEVGGDPRDQRDLAVVDRLDIGDYYNTHASSVDAAVKTAANMRPVFRSVNQTAWGALAVLGWRDNAAVFNDFNDKIRSGANLGAGDPRLALRNWMSNERTLRNAGEHLALYIKTWNAWVLGESRQLASIRPDEPFPAFVSTSTHPLRAEQLGHLASLRSA